MRPQNKLFAFFYDGFLLLAWMVGSLRQTLRGRHTKYLEAEVERLKAENRALWTSIWSQQGHGKPDLPDIPQNPTQSGVPWAPQPSTPAAGKVAEQGAKPRMGRQSWPQTAARLEREADERLKREAMELVNNAIGDRAKVQVTPDTKLGAGQSAPPREPIVEEEAHAN